MVESTVECISVEGQGARVVDGDRREEWIRRYLAKYQPVAADLSADFVRRNALFEFTPERAFAIIEREQEFATRATRWVFDH